MARIMIENLFKITLEVTDHTKTLLEHFQDHGIDWMHACGGQGRCTTCKVIVQEGQSNFQGLTRPEKSYFAEGALNAHERLACQSKISGDVCLLVPKEYQLPHLQYSDES
jgi:ferredoxin, 2Fe-2S